MSGMQPTACPTCACRDLRGSAAHAVLAALAGDDLDRAITLGLLDATACPACAPVCASALTHARDARLRALAARERYLARQARLRRRADEQRAKRAPATETATAATAATLPPAAAAALARAKAKAAGRSST